MYSGFHNLGSGTWYDRNNGLDQGLGEDIGWRRKWDRGDPPPVLPNAEVVGSRDCIGQGESIDNALSFSQLEAGLPPLCWVPHVIGDPLWSIAGAWYSCSLQYFYLTAIQLLYNRDATNLRLIFRMLLGNTISTFFHQGTTQLPDVFVVVTDECSIIVVDGTVNFQQLALQCFLGVIPPTNQGAFSTQPLWYVAASYANALAVADGVDPLKPIILVGHSYGAAVCNVLAGRYRFIRPQGQVRLLTCGDPKPGDSRLQRILGGTAGIALANDDDLVTILPPDALTIWPVVVAEHYTPFLIWDRWKRPPNQALLNGDGSLNFNKAAITDYTTMYNAANSAYAHIPLGIITGHFLSEYRDRTLLRCQSAEWPISNALLALLKTL